MAEGEKKSGAGTAPGGSQRRIVFAILAVAVVILAGVSVAKFGYNVDLLNPAGGQMSLVQRPIYTVVPLPATLVSSVPTPVVVHQSTLATRCSPDTHVSFQNRSDLAFVCGDILCNDVCFDTCRDNSNCGSCGNVCPPGTHCDTGECKK